MTVSIVVICGPTGSGKGALARELAGRMSGEIVSADSRKIYRRMDAGTAKPDRAARAGIPHHLLDVAEPGAIFSAARWAGLADEAIAGIVARGRLPIVAGGTGLYLRALIRGIIQTPPRDDALRESLELAEDAEPGSLHRRLAALDPVTAARIPPGDRVRLVRALEVLELTGRTMSQVQAEQAESPPRYRAWQAAIAWSLPALHERIDARVERMLAAGWLDEVRALRAAGAGRALQVVGYKQLDAHLDGEMGLDAAVVKIKQAHRRYARRQRTWFRAVEGLRWIEAPVDVDAAEGEVRAFLSGQL